MVGIDGSQSAIGAAEWAADEAINRDVPLRLIHVMTEQPEPAPLTSVGNVRRELDYGLEYAEAALRSASAAVSATAKPVKVETVIVRGDPVATLVAESRYADMVCVGAVGIGRFTRAILGSTAAELASSARCPVAIIRTEQNRSKADEGWIVVWIDGPSANEGVIAYAMDEAGRRHAPVLAVGALHDGKDTSDELDTQVQMLSRRYPDVHIYSVKTRTGVTEFLADNTKQIQLAVIGSSEAHQLAQLIGPHGHPILNHAQCSVLVVRS
ncbi:universal stress protein [Mycobacterium botniense]|uniref:Universal stress protein n=1 Tax=Mycobacterium botniense TaxID=84962 RepID=A0A7I9Y2E7_9MYCO|nr:universal stress protein [Mycobacterium botniense]